MSGQDRTCLLCGTSGRDVTCRLARFDPPLPSGAYQAIDRCTDSQACRDRLAAAGDDWPLDDRTTQPGGRGSTGAGASRPEPLGSASPVPDRFKPSGRDDERPAWESAS